MPVSPAKRQRERNQLDRQREKERRRDARRTEKQVPRVVTPGEDPDIAGIVPGPQPVVEDY